MPIRNSSRCISIYNNFPFLKYCNCFRQILYCTVSFYSRILSHKLYQQTTFTIWCVTNGLLSSKPLMPQISILNYCLHKCCWASYQQTTNCRNHHWQCILVSYKWFRITIVFINQQTTIAIWCVTNGLLSSRPLMPQISIFTIFHS